MTDIPCEQPRAPAFHACPAFAVQFGTYDDQWVVYCCLQPGVLPPEYKKSHKVCFMPGAVMTKMSVMHIMHIDS